MTTPDEKIEYTISNERKDVNGYYSEVTFKGLLYICKITTLQTDPIKVIERELRALNDNQPPFEL
jgi:hypothetical protein